VTGTNGGPSRSADSAGAQLHAALLPAGLPVLPQVQIAARYLPAPVDEAAGGDWFDAIVLPAGSVALIAGEVPGSGPTASAAMGQLRGVLNDLLATVPDLATVLARADAFAARTPGLMAVTLAIAVLEPASGRVRYSVCGQPPPLTVASSGEVGFLDSGPSGPLGTGSAPNVAAAVLRPGELVVLYSDGLTALPGRTSAEALSELAAVAAVAAVAGAAGAAAGRLLSASPDAIAPDRVCQLAAELATRSGYVDDVTVLAAQRLATAIPALHMRLPARFASLADARHRFGQWLAEAAPLAAGQDVLQLALGEILANAVEHAYPPGAEGSVDIYAEICGNGLLECRIADDGRWREPGHAEDRGNGLMLAAYLSGEFIVSHPPQPADAPPGSCGTVVTLRRRLLRPAELEPVPGAGDGVGGARSGGTQGGTRSGGAGSSFRAEIPFAGHAVVHGAVASGAAERFAGRLLAACRGGTVPLTADLSGVTRLDTAAVQVLFQVRDRLAAHRHDLRLLVEPGSPAGPVLDLACLPHTAPAVTSRPDGRAGGAPGQRTTDAGPSRHPTWPLPSGQRRDHRPQ